MSESLKPSFISYQQMDFSSSDFGEIWPSIISVTVNCIVSLHFAMLFFFFLDKLEENIINKRIARKIQRVHGS